MKLHFLFLCLLPAIDLFGQDENFASDRPGLSDAPDLIDKRSWQIATGFDISTYNHYGIYQLSQNTLKYGINRRLEARLDFSVQYDHVKNIYGTAPPSIGLKALLSDQKKLLPKTAFIVEYYPPLFSATQQPSGLAAELCFSHNFKTGNSLYYNIGANWQDVTRGATLNSLLGFSYGFTKRMNAFVELYVYKKPAVKTNFVTDVGVTYLLKKKLQLDFACGLDLENPDGNYYFDGGISYNF